MKTVTLTEKQLETLNFVLSNEYGISQDEPENNKDWIIALEDVSKTLGFNPKEWN